MKWIKFSSDCIESEDSRYSIDRARMDAAGTCRFTAWFRGVKPSENLGCCDTAELAKDLCALHERAALITTELEFAPQEIVR
jgi:hypothetical protein